MIKRVHSLIKSLTMPVNKQKIIYLEAIKKKKSSKSKTSRKKKKNSKKSSLKWRLFIWSIYLLLISIITLGCYIFYCYITMPNIQDAVSKIRQPSTIIMAENGNDIAKFGNVYADTIYPDNLPQNITNAIIATEDRRFYKHFGFDILGFSRAILTNLYHRRYVQGASTITQQVAKNIFLTPNKTIKRKVQELLLSFWLEKKLTKNQILALYLNRVYFGSSNYGIEAASNWYFNKTSYELNLREAAILAGMLKAPNRYNPIFKKDAALQRANVVLHNMLKNDFITEQQYKEAKTLPISNGQKYRVSGGKHFAQYVYDKVNNYIGERTDDIVVMTTLDQKLQETAETILQTKIEKFKNKNVTEGAVIIMDKNGAIKAMVGGVDYNKSQFNRATQAKRQAGSAFKPIVYLTALEKGFTPDSTIRDYPITIGNWKPENYSRRYYGDVTLDFALTNSLNVATVVLSKNLKLKDIATNAYKMGISTQLSLSPSMVLGTNEVKLLDMVTAYTSIANGGKSVHVHAINEISTQNGHQLYVRKKYKEKQIINTKTVQQLTNILENVINKGTGRAAQLPIFAAGKTGTTQNYRDAWFIGWTNKYIAAVWVGNDNDKPMNKIVGSGLPAEIWHDIMITTIKDTPKNLPKKTSFLEKVTNFIGLKNQDVDEIAELIDSEASNIDNNSPQTIDDLIDTF